MRHARSFSTLALVALLLRTGGERPSFGQSAPDPVASPTPVKVRLRPVLMKKESVRLEPVLSEPASEPTPEATPTPEAAATVESAPPAPEATTPSATVAPTPESSSDASIEDAPARIDATPASTPEPTPASRAPVVETPVPVSEVRPAASASSDPALSPEPGEAPRPSSVRLERTGSDDAPSAAQPAEPPVRPEPPMATAEPAPSEEPAPSDGTSTAAAPATAASVPAPVPGPRPLVEDPTATQLLVQVRAAIDAGDTAGGRVMAMRIAERHPDSTAAPEALFLATSGLDDLGGAVRELLALVDRYPDSPAAGAALVRAGEFSFLLGDHAGAASAFERYMARSDASPDRLPQVESRRALALLRAARFPEARAAFEALFDSREEMLESPAMLESYAETLMGLGDHVAAREILDRVDGRFPSYENAVKVLMGRGLCAEILGETEAARRIYSTIVTNYPASLEAPLAGRRVSDLGRPLVP